MNIEKYFKHHTEHEQSLINIHTEPIITSENTGGSDLIVEGEHGFTVPIRDVEELKSKMQYMYDQIEQTKIMGNKAKDRVQKLFTWNNYGSSIFDAYSNVFKK